MWMAPPGKQGATDTHRLCDITITFYLMCHDATSYLHSDMCFFLKINKLNIRVSHVAVKDKVM